MKIKELREKTKAELSDILKERNESLRKFRFQIANSKTKNTKEAREIRKDIARINTLLKG